MRRKIFFAPLAEPGGVSPRPPAGGKEGVISFPYKIDFFFNIFIKCTLQFYIFIRNHNHKMFSKLAMLEHDNAIVKPRAPRPPAAPKPKPNINEISGCYEYEKYVCRTSEEIDTMLETYGVAIIPEVLNNDECDRLFEGVFDSLEFLTKNTENPIVKNNSETWKNFKTLFPLHSMLVQYWNIGNTQCIWDVRQNPKVVDIFSKIYHEPHEDLLVSYDAVSFHFPPEVVKFGWNRNNTWYHTDQSFTCNKRECIQGWVTAKDVNIGDATLAFLEGSHLFHGLLAKQFQKTDKSDWCKLTEEEFMFYKEQHCTEKKIFCPKGSLVLWDSRTIHCGSEAHKEREIPNFRCVVYVCYKPRSMCTPANLKKKQKAFNDKRMTTHDPCKVRLFGKQPRTYGNPLPTNISELEFPVLSDLGKRLAGF